MNFTPTYADYLRYHGGNLMVPDENGTIFRNGMSEDQFNSVSDADKWGFFGGGYGFDPGDPRYDYLRSQISGEPGRSIYISPNAPSSSDLVHPENLFHGDGVYGFGVDNMTPGYQHRGDAPLWPVFALPLAFMGAGALAGAFDGAGAAAAGSSAAGDISPGLLSNFSVDTVGADAMVDPLTGLAGGGATGGAGATGLTGEPWSGAYGGLDPETAAGSGGMGVAQNGIGPGSLMDRLTGAINNPSSLLSSNGLLGQSLSGLAPDSLSGLLRLAGGAQTLAGLFGHNNSGGNGGGGGGDGGGDKGGGGQALKISRGEFTPNPITQQQLQNFRYAQPRSR